MQASTKWLTRPNVSRRFAAVVVLVWFGIGFWSHGSLGRWGYSEEVAAQVSAKVSAPLDFKVRDWLELTPKISPELVILSLDDKTLQQLEGGRIDLPEWAELLTAIANQQPRAIFIDKIWQSLDRPYGVLSDDADQQVDAAIAKLEQITTPIYVGNIVVANEIPTAHRWPLTGEQYSLDRILGGDRSPSFMANAPLDPKINHRVYGPHYRLHNVVTATGHIVYADDGYFSSLMQVADDRAVPVMPFLLPGELSIKDRRLFADGKHVPTDHRGRIVVNLPPTRTFYTKDSRSFSLQNNLKRVRQGLEIKNVRPGDVVLILPTMFSGSADFHPSPVGEIPGGLLHASMLNSLLTDQWLHPLAYSWLLSLIVAVMAGALAMLASTIWFGVGLTVLVSTVVFGGLLAFSYASMVVPWVQPAVVAIGCGLTVFVAKARSAEMKARYLREALGGMVAPADLKDMEANPERVNFEACERVVTLMFIDVVGFSLLAENMLPRMAFDNLKDLIRIIGETVFRYGGVIDKTLGDGLLCYFGYKFTTDESIPDHAERALRCAIEIQEMAMERNIGAAESGEPVYPLRIGINTASCHIGDLGVDKTDLTVVGNGVNYAKRLEGACEMYSVLFGSTTHDLVKGIGLPEDGFHRRFIRIKHHSELVEAIEFDPFYDQVNLRQRAVEDFRRCANIERIDQRWPVHDPSKIQLTCDFGVGQLVNFSHTGFSIRLDQPLAKGTAVSIALDAAGGILKSLLEKQGIEVLHGEVRWGYVDGKTYVHGIAITNLTAIQSDYLVQYLVEFAFSQKKLG